MAAEAVPCIVCGNRLKNVSEDSENQPYAGTAFTSHGHYGSTAFDPMDGHFLEINVCDVCLVRAARRLRVLWNRDGQPVMDDGVVVGWELVRVEGYVSWKPELDCDLEHVAGVAREEGLLGEGEEL